MRGQSAALVIPLQKLGQLEKAYERILAVLPVVPTSMSSAQPNSRTLSSNSRKQQQAPGPANRNSLARNSEPFQTSGSHSYGSDTRPAKAPPSEALETLVKKRIDELKKQLGASSSLRNATAIRSAIQTNVAGCHAFQAKLAQFHAQLAQLPQLQSQRFAGTRQPAVQSRSSPQEGPSLDLRTLAHFGPDGPDYATQGARRTNLGGSGGGRIRATEASQPSGGQNSETISIDGTTIAPEPSRPTTPQDVPGNAATSAWHGTFTATTTPLTACSSRTSFGNPATHNHHSGPGHLCTSDPPETAVAAAPGAQPAPANDFAHCRRPRSEITVADQTAVPVPGSKRPQIRAALRGLRDRLVRSGRSSSPSAN